MDADALYRLRLQNLNPHAFSVDSGTIKKPLMLKNPQA